MASVLNHMKSARIERQGIPPLEPGDHLDQKSFHERYETMPNGIKAELIEGVVYMPSPLKVRHGRASPELTCWLVTYKGATPGTDVLENATIILGPRSEPQPDACLLVLPQNGGQTRIEYDTEDPTDGYIVGPPELAAEVASSTDSYDLHSKKADYERVGVKEYLVITLRQQEVFWFGLRSERYERMSPGTDGILRSEVFPGLWLDPNAILDGNTSRMLAVLQQGLATPEHKAWVSKLAASAKIVS
jgi:Uma2 family endonuclease